MTTTITPEMDTTFTLYWQKYILVQKQSGKKERETSIDMKILATESYKNPKKDISEYDTIAYLQ